MPNQVESMTVRGFRSLLDVRLEGLPMAAILIGANGSGKSNFMRFFDMLSWMIGPRRLAEFVQLQGGADDQLYGGGKTSETLEAELAIRTERGRNDYRFKLAYGHPDRFVFTDESFRFTHDGLNTTAPWQHLGSGHLEAKIVELPEGETGHGLNPKTAGVIVHLLQGINVYQFHDTSSDSRIKKRCDPTDNGYLRSHGGNLAAVLLRLEREHVGRYDMICSQIRRALPVFDRFDLQETSEGTMLRWKSAGTDKSIGAHLTSDGSLRFFALVTLLNLPTDMLPHVVLLDEPELGLHPAAVTLVGDMIKACATERQILVATQSPFLVDAFDLDEIFVLETDAGRTIVQRHEEKQFENWLARYSTGEIWQKNLLGGRP